MQNEYRIQGSQPLFTNSYNLSGSGVLSAGSITSTGGGAVPQLTQSGGTLLAGAITLLNSGDVYSMSGGQASIQGNLTGNGTLRVSGGQLFVGGQIIAESQARVIVSGGTLDVMGSLDLAGNFSGGTLHQTGGVVRARAATLNHGTVQFDAGSFSVGTLSLSSFGQFILGPGADKVVRTTAIQLVGPGSKIDLGEAAAVVDYNGGSPLLQIRSWLVFGYNGGTWDGGLGIGTRFGSATTHGIGYAEAADVGTPAPIFGAVDADTVLLRFTRYGDADLNGVVNLDDFNRLATNFGSSSGTVWSQGDFTYDGSVNLDDFNRLAANFGFAASGPTVTPLDWSALISAVPEPTLPLLAVPTLVFLRRRHRVAAAAQ